MSRISDKLTVRSHGLQSRVTSHASNGGGDHGTGNGHLIPADGRGDARRAVPRAREAHARPRRLPRLQRAARQLARLHLGADRPPGRALAGGAREDGSKPGDRVAVMLRNSPEWVTYDQAALGLGLVVVPLYTQDRPDNVAYIITDAGCKVLLIDGPEQWQEFADVKGQLGEPDAHPDGEAGAGLRRAAAEIARRVAARARAAKRATCRATRRRSRPSSTPRARPAGPKGVMLSHHNILSNAEGALQRARRRRTTTSSCRSCRCRTPSSAPAAITSPS